MQATRLKLRFSCAKPTEFLSLLEPNVLTNLDTGRITAIFRFVMESQQERQESLLKKIKDALGYGDNGGHEPPIFDTFRTKWVEPRPRKYL